jgi:YD repeat-containing protein
MDVTVYAYDPVGNVLQTVETQDAATTTSAYVYDWLDRLTSGTVAVTVGGGTPTQTITQYAYDSLGNLLSKTKDGIGTSLPRRNKLVFTALPLLFWG